VCYFILVLSALGIQGSVISKILSITDRRSKQNLTLIGVIRQLRDCNENLITSYKSYKEILSFAE
jgi:hypothetical protein